MYLVITVILGDSIFTAAIKNGAYMTPELVTDVVSSITSRCLSKYLERLLSVSAEKASANVLLNNNIIFYMD